ncbi:MAG TPA: hypothetical protein VNJ52_03565, partial [Patescibacteria group bacterium]|nr:hypothetical protein [Patescibacteria group bacterium]
VPYANYSNPQSLNLYNYTLDNPETNVDLDGHCQLPLFSTTCAGGSHRPPVRPPAPKQINSTQERNGNIIYNETGGLRPTERSGSGSATQMRSARVGIGHVLINREAIHLARGVASSYVSLKNRNNAEYKDSQAAAIQAARTPDTTRGATHFYLHWVGHPAPPWAHPVTPVAYYGPFLNASGGGDVPKNVDVWILIIP